MYPALGCEVRSELATALGAIYDDAGCLLVDAQQRTAASGVLAAGDVVSDLHQLSVAVTPRSRAPRYTTACRAISADFLV